MKARMICSWCGRFIRWTETSDGKPSHGICNKCYEREMQKLDNAPPAGESKEA